MKRCQNKSNISVIKDYLDGKRPFVQVGFVPAKTIRKIGEIWTDSSGITWKQEEGYRTRVNNQADIIRKSSQQICNQCNGDIRWGTKLDRYFFSRTGLCENCLITYETNLRILGVYEFYERYKLISYELGRLFDAKEKIEEIIKFFKEDDGTVEMICNSEGFIERWKNTNTDKIREDAIKDLTIVNENIEKLLKIKEEAKQLYIDSVKSHNIETYV